MRYRSPSSSERLHVELKQDSINSRINPVYCHKIISSKQFSRRIMSKYTDIIIENAVKCFLGALYRTIYSQHPLTRTLRGNQNLFDLANIRVNERNL